MGLLLFLIILAVWGFVVGGLARWAVPGPDPMSVWMTMALGLAGSFLGGVIARVLFGTAAGFVLSFLGAVILLILYRKFVQHRPITGPAARQPPAS